MKTEPIVAEPDALGTAPPPAEADPTKEERPSRKSRLQADAEAREVEPTGLLLAARSLRLISTGCSLLAQLGLGLAIGFLGAEACSWARWGASSGPSLVDGFRFIGLKLPLAGWIGVERALEWAFTQSAFVCAGLFLGAVSICSKTVATALEKLHSAVMWRRLLALAAGRPHVRVVHPLKAAMNASDIALAALYIEQAYDMLDQRGRDATSKLTASQQLPADFTADVIANDTEP